MKDLDEIKEIVKKRTEGAEFSGLRQQQEKDEKYYELEFSVPLPKIARQIIPPHARELVDVQLIQLLSGSIVASQPSRKEGEKYEKMSAQVDRWLAGWIDMLLKINPSPLEMGLKDMGLRGEVFWKVVYEPRDWRLRKQKGESSGDYDERLTIHKLNNFPLKLMATEPMHCYPDLQNSGSLVPLNMVESYKRKLGEIRFIFGEIPALEDIKDEEEVKWSEYWGEEERCFLANDEPVFSQKVQVNHYGFAPYVHAYSGLGYRSSDGKVEKLARSLIYPFRDMIVGQARMFSQIESIVDLYAWPTAIAKNVPTDFQPHMEPGGITEVPPGGDFIIQEGIAPPRELFTHLALLTSIIEGGGMQPALAGEAVGRGSLQLETAIGQGRKRLMRVLTNYENSLAVALGLGLRILEKLIAEPVGVKTMEIKKDGETVVSEVSLEPDQIKGYYIVKVNIKPQDDVEDARKKALGADLQGKGIIAWRTNLIDYHGKTPAEADEMITRALAEHLVMTEPIQTGMAMAAAEQLEILDEIRKAQEAGAGELAKTKALGRRTGGPMATVPPSPQPSPSPASYAEREIREQGGLPLGGQ